jgi:pilus assembly protein Flp/PilA
VTHSLPTAVPPVSTGAASLHAALAISLRLIRDDSGQDIIEYALIAATIGLASVAGVHGLANSVANDLNIVVGDFNNAVGPYL